MEVLVGGLVCWLTGMRSWLGIWQLVSGCAYLAQGILLVCCFAAVALAYYLFAVF